MKHTTLTLSLLSSLLFTGCFTSNDSDTNTGVIPSADNFFYSIPSALAAENPSEELVVVEPTSAARIALSDDEADGAEKTSVFKVYEPVPKFIHLAEEAKENVKNLVNELHSYNIPEEFDAVENGLYIKSRSIDTTIAGLDQKFFMINVKNDEGQEILFMNYYKNARGQYRGNFYFSETNPASENFGARVHVHYNGHNEALFGKRMMVTFYKPADLISKSGDPSILRVWSRKKGDKVFVTGASYHPNFVDEFWPEGPKVYAFRTVADIAKDQGVLSVAFADANADLTHIFKDYALDDVVVKQFVEAYKKEINLNDTLKNAVAWSLENKKDLLSLYASIGAGTYKAASLDVSELSVEQFLEYVEINKDFFKAEAKRTGDNGFLELLVFIEIEQPIFLKKGGVIVGGKSNEEKIGFAIESADLESTEFQELDLSNLESFDPDSQEEPSEIKE